MDNITTKLKELLLAPIQKYLLLFAILIVFMNLSCTVFFFINQNVYYAVQMFFVSVLVSYITTIAICLPPPAWRNLLIFSLLPALLLVQVMQMITFSYFGVNSIGDLIAVVACTNISELIEAFSYFPLVNVVLCLCSLLSIVAIPILLKKNISKFQTNNKFISITLILCIIGGICVSVHNPMIYSDTYINTIPKYFHGFKNEKPQLVYPQLIYPGELPDNVVIIIGESFVKSHSSLYGYEKETNPRLIALRDSGDLFVYNKAVAPYTHTVECFKSMMSTYKREYEDSTNWNECVSIPEVMRVIGYHTSWYSNQSKKGFCDNVPSGYSDLCNENYFVGNKYAGGFRYSYDEEIIDLLQPEVNNKKTSYNCYFVHMMGQHGPFENRYPDGFGKFKADDYISSPESQRKRLSEYDNATLYNDFVVCEIIKLFEEKEAIVFYFSDHGLDANLVHSNHSDINSFKEGTNIPFMIYATEKYQERFPDKVEFFRNTIDNEIYTEDFIYLLMDVLEVKFKNNSNTK